MRILHSYGKFTTIKVISLVLILMFALGGCWDRNELSSLAIATGAAFDKPQSKVGIDMTTQVINLDTLAPVAVHSTIAAPPYWNIKTTGQTVFDCIRNASQQSTHKLYWAHNQIIVFSEDLARESGVRQYLDFFLRDAEPRVSTWVLVSKGKASDILEMESKLEPIPAVNIASLIENRKYTGKASAVDLYEFSNRMLSEATAPVMSLIELVDENDEKIPLLSGTAVFNQDGKMIGTLNELETRGMLLAIDQFESGLLVVEAPDSKGQLGIEILNSSAKIKPQISDGRLKIKIDIKVSGSLGDANCYVDVLDENTWNSINQRQAEAIRRDILLSLKQARTLKADIFGFGDAVYKKYPQEWKKMKPDWEEIFPSLEVEIEAQTTLVRPNMILQSIKGKKEG